MLEVEVKVRYAHYRFAHPEEWFWWKGLWRTIPSKALVKIARTDAVVAMPGEYADGRGGATVCIIDDEEGHIFLGGSRCRRDEPFTYAQGRAYAYDYASIAMGARVGFEKPQRLRFKPQISRKEAYRITKHPEWMLVDEDGKQLDPKRI
jgi:hypothetical protein